MLKVAFFNRPLIFEKGIDVFEIQDRFIHYGTLSLATYLQSKGSKIKVFDYYETAGSETLDRVKEDLRSFAPDIVGISAFTTDIHNANQTAKFIKKILGDEVRVVVGGCHFSALPEETMKKFPNFDIGVVGEGELTMEELVRGKSPKDVEGLVYRGGNGKIIRNRPREELVDLNELPLPKYELFDLQKYVQFTYQGFLKPKKKKLVLPVETSRGCPFGCKFCFRTVGLKLRLKEPERVVREIKRIVEKFRVDQIEIIDGTFGISKNQALKILELLVREGLNKKIKFLVRVRADVLDSDVAKALKEAGCHYLSIGIEAASDSILEKSGKGITTKQIKESVILAAKAGLEIHSNFILGLPYETEKDIREKAEFAKSLPNIGANFAILVPFPGTEIYQWAKEEKMGYKLATEDYHLFGKQGGKALINKRLSYQKLKELQKYCYKKFYLSSPRRFLVFLSLISFKRLRGIIRFGAS